jgi:hypothetical protein
MPTYRSALQGGSKLPLLYLELARGAGRSRLPVKESGSKLPHSKPSLKKEGDKEWEWPKSTNSGGLQPGSADRGEQRITSIPLFSAR